MISDEDLLLYYYRELEADERARISAALAEQPELAQRLHKLVARLDTVAATPEVPVPASVQQRWQSALDGAVRGDSRAAPSRRTFTNPRWLAMAAGLAVVALAVTFQVMQPRTSGLAQIEPPGSEAPAAVEGAAYENGLKFHLASTERQIAALGEATPEERARLIETIIAQNRLYALAAERAGEPQLARVLRAFTPILDDLAHGRGETTAANVAQLSFELRVMQARLGAGAATTNTL
ncbi:MAG TPA: hypothetical protein VM146_11685 [Steroidobacteraceae bacterium]|nr:hypothetical protein [Steroidobacteraceae bacterium]